MCSGLPKASAHGPPDAQQLLCAYAYTRMSFERQIMPILESVLKIEGMPEECCEVIGEIQEIVLSLKNISASQYDSTDVGRKAQILCESLNYVAWIRLHAEPWTNVPMFWRRIYSLSCLCLCFLCGLKCLQLYDKMKSISKKREHSSSPTTAAVSARQYRIKLYHIGVCYVQHFLRFLWQSTDMEDEISCTLKQAFYYADMGLIMGGYFREVWVPPNDPTLINDESRSSALCRFRDTIEGLEHVCEVLHQLFNPSVGWVTDKGYKGCWKTKDIQLLSHVQEPYLFYLLKTFQHLKPLCVPCTPRMETMNLAADQTSFCSPHYTFHVNDKNVWEVVCHTTHNRYGTDGAWVSRNTPLYDILDRFVSKRVACMIRLGALHYPALDRWKNVPERLLQVCGLRSFGIDTIVDVYGSSPLKLVITSTMSYGLLLSSCCRVSVHSQVVDTAYYDDPRMMYIDTHWLCAADHHEHLGYIAQHPMLDHMPQLHNEMLISDIVGAATDSDHVIKLLWIGPGGTISPYHTDSHDNLYTQIAGFKLVIVGAPPATVEAMYPYDTMVTNTSTIEPFDVMRYPVDLNKYPLFPCQLQNTYVLGPGDQLFIPKGWWHFVKALTTSVSLSVWFDVD